MRSRDARRLERLRVQPTDLLTPCHHIKLPEMHGAAAATLPLLGHLHAQVNGGAKCMLC